MTTILRFTLFFLLAPVFAIVAQAAGVVQDDFLIVDTGFQTGSVILNSVGDEICNYDSSGALLHKRKSIDCEDDLSGHEGFGFIGAAQPLFSFFAEFVAANKGPVIIGETMARVEAAASKIPDAKILNDMPDFKAMGMGADEVTSSLMQYNRKWIFDQMRSGREIIDIGLDANRKNPSIFYQMEQNMLKNYDILNPGSIKVTTP